MNSTAFTAHLVGDSNWGGTRCNYLWGLGH